MAALYMSANNEYVTFAHHICIISMFLLLTGFPPFSVALNLGVIYEHIATFLSSICGPELKWGFFYQHIAVVVAPAWVFFMNTSQRFPAMFVASDLGVF